MGRKHSSKSYLKDVLTIIATKEVNNMETKQIPDLTFDDLMTGIPEDFVVKYKEIIVILLAQMIEMTKDESELFIKV